MSTSNLISNNGISALTDLAIRNLTLSGSENVSGAVTLSNTTNATSVSAGGALTIAGGAAIAKRLYVGGSTEITNSSATDGTKISGDSLDSVTNPFGDFQGNGQLLIKGSTSPDKRLALGYDTINDYSVIQSAESGVALKPLYLNPSGGNVVIGTTTTTAAIRGTTDSSSTTSGALTLAGGLGVAKKLFVGQSANITNTSAIAGTRITGDSLDSLTDPFGDFTGNGQLVISGSTDTDKRLALGYDTISDYAVIQSIESGVGNKTLWLQRAGGNIGMGLDPTDTVTIVGKIWAGAGFVSGDPVITNLANITSVTLENKFKLTNTNQAYADLLFSVVATATNAVTTFKISVDKATNFSSVAGAVVYGSRICSAGTPEFGAVSGASVSGEKTITISFISGTVSATNTISVRVIYTDV